MSRTDKAVEHGSRAQLEGDLRRTKAIEDAALDLARDHINLDPKARIFWDSSEPDAVRLVEVSPEVPDTDEVLAYRFSASPDFEVQFDLYLALLSPNEWERVRAGRLKFPKGWGEPAQFQELLPQEAR